MVETVLPRRFGNLISLAASGGALLLLVGLVAFGLVDTGPSPPEKQWLGMEVEPLTPSMRAGLGLAADQSGVLVSDVVGVARLSGVREGDVIVAVNGSAVADLASFAEAARTASPAQTSILMVNRQGTILSVPVAAAAVIPPAAIVPIPATASPGPPTSIAAPYPAPVGVGSSAPYPAPPAQAQDLSPPASPSLGIDVADLAPDAAAPLGLAPPYHGAIVTVVTPQGAAEQAGILPNDVVMRANGVDVLTRDQFWALLGSQPASAPLILDLWRSGGFVQIRVAPLPSSASSVAPGATVGLTQPAWPR